MEDNLVGKLGVLDDAHSPHHGEVVEIVAVNGDVLTVKPKEPAEFDFAEAELPREHVRLL